MKKVILIVLTLFLVSCSSHDNKILIENEVLLGKWKIIETLIDPGDGSGTFQPTESDRVIEFFNNGTVIINGELCYTSSEVGAQQSGTFKFISSHETDTNHDGEIKPNNCENSVAKIYFDINSNNQLILWYPCIEGCGEKFEKI